MTDMEKTILEDKIWTLYHADGDDYVWGDIINWLDHEIFKGVYSGIWKKAKEEGKLEDNTDNDEEVQEK
jgi:hypothetical protein